MDETCRFEPSGDFGSVERRCYTHNRAWPCESRPTIAEQPFVSTSLGTSLLLDWSNLPESISATEALNVLPRLPRWGGRTLVTYCVADHVVRVLERVIQLGGGAEDQWAAWHHEGDEVLLGFDPPSPLLRVCPDLADLKKRAHAAWSARFGLNPQIPEIVKIADGEVCATEHRDLMPPSKWAWFGAGAPPRALPERMCPRSLYTVRLNLLDHFVRLARAVGCNERWIQDETRGFAL